MAGAAGNAGAEGIEHACASCESKSCKKLDGAVVFVKAWYSVHSVAMPLSCRQKGKVDRRQPDLRGHAELPGLWGHGCAWWLAHIDCSRPVLAD
jgi:hypothetical protein